MILIMKNKNKRNFLMMGILAICTVIPTASFAQEVIASDTTDQAIEDMSPWDLEKCIDYAIVHNITIKTRELTTENKKLSKNDAKWARLPNLNASVRQGYNWGRSVSPATNTYTDINSRSSSFGISTNVPLFTGLRIPNQYKLSKVELSASLADLDQAKENLSVQIAQQYLQVLFTKELLGVAKEQAQLSQTQYERFQELFRLGKTAQSDVSEARARVAQDQYSLTSAGNNYQLAKLDLVQLLELTSMNQFSIVSPSNIGVENVLIPMDEVYSNALNTRAEMRAAKLRYKGSKYSINIAKSAYYPTLSIGGNLGTGYNKVNGSEAESFSKQIDHNLSKSVGITLSIPIFNRFSTRNNIRRARLQKEQYALQLEDTRKKLYKEIQQAWYNAAASQAQYESAVVAKQANQEAFNLMQKKFMQGQATSLQFSESKTNLMKSVSEQLQAKYQYLFRTKILQFYDGEPLK